MEFGDPRISGEIILEYFGMGLDAIMKLASPLLQKVVAESGSNSEVTAGIPEPLLEGGLTDGGTVSSVTRTTSGPPFTATGYMTWSSKTGYRTVAYFSASYLENSRHRGVSPTSQKRIV